jgi:hypothetical protein
VKEFNQLFLMMMMMSKSLVLAKINKQMYVAVHSSTAQQSVGRTDEPKRHALRFVQLLSNIGLVMRYVRPSRAATVLGF